jgi:hypothetical protein
MANLLFARSCSESSARHAEMAQTLCIQNTRSLDAPVIGAERLPWLVMTHCTGGLEIAGPGRSAEPDVLEAQKRSDPLIPGR